MKIYLAGAESSAKIFYEYENEEKKPYVLVSYVYCRSLDIERLKRSTKDIILDSGAYTYRKKEPDVNWDKYAEDYANYVKKWNIEKYFELDIDNIIGYEEVKRLRAKIEKIVGWQCIPVWHVPRGKEDFVETCKKYKYISLGGLVGMAKEKIWKYGELFPWFVKTAHKYGAKIHGLGITSKSTLQYAHFDSVDSTSWQSGFRYGRVAYFKNNKMITVDKPKGKRLKHRTILARFAIDEYIKYQEWAERNL